MGVREIDMATPHPMIYARSARLNESRRLGVVDHHEFGIERESRPITLVVHQKNFEIPPTCMIGRAVQCVMKCLGYLKKILAARHHVPFDVKLQFFRQGHQTI